MCTPSRTPAPRARARGAFAALAALALTLAGCAADVAAPSAVAEVDLGGDRTLERGKPRVVSATVRYEDGTTELATPADGLEVVVDDPGVVRVQGDGEVRGLAVGVTTLRAAFGGKTAAQRVVVAR